MASSSGCAKTKRIWCSLLTLIFFLWKQTKIRVTTLKARSMYLKDESTSYVNMSITYIIVTAQSQSRINSYILLIPAEAIISKIHQHSIGTNYFIKAGFILYHVVTAGKMNLVASIQLGDKKQSDTEIEITIREDSGDTSNRRAVMRSMQGKAVQEDSPDFKRVCVVLFLNSEKLIQLVSLAVPKAETSAKYIHKSIRQVLREEQERVSSKKVLILYTSGSAGANLNIEIVRGLLKSKMIQNQYLYDYKAHEALEDKQFLVTPQQQNGVRILYKIEESQAISHSINVTLSQIKQIAEKIHSNYQKYDAFIVLCGEDAICMISTLISFMFENLSKLVIFTGGFFPITYMRNDIVGSLIESFAVISLAQNFNEVIIISKNKGYRANRCIKMKEGDLRSVASPNLDPLVSVNIKLNFREHLFLHVPVEPFTIWTDLSSRVGIIKFHILLSTEALQYEVNNPAYDGFVVQSYASNNLPDNLQILNLFKKTAQEKGTIFVTVAQSAQKVNYSSKKEYLEQFHIYFGGDMTTEAASAKLSYLLSKKYPRNEIKRLIETNMRGELTEIKKDNQFSSQNHSFMELVIESIKDFYPTIKFNSFINQIQDSLSKFITRGSNQKQLEQVFKKTHVDQKSGEETYSKNLVQLVNRNSLLHKAVRSNNIELCRYFLSYNIDVNRLNEEECSALFYAVALRDKKATLYLSKKGAQVICPLDDLFQLIASALLKDDWQFFELLYHIQFKETLPQQMNMQGRNALHLAAILGADKSLKYMMQKFKFNFKAKDKHGKLYSDYLKYN